MLDELCSERTCAWHEEGPGVSLTFSIECISVEEVYTILVTAGCQASLRGGNLHET